MIKKILGAAAVGAIAIGSAALAGEDKVLICHNTSSESNPTFVISVSANSVDAHLAHGDYLLPEGDTDCSGGGGPMPE